MAHVPRIHVTVRLRPGGLTLDADQARRLAAVMRLRAGDTFLVFSGDGTEWRAIIQSERLERNTLRATVEELVRQEPPAPLVLEVWCALVRPARFDAMIEKCTEAGADVIRPLITEHAARGEGNSATRQARWQRIAVEASEQCGRLHVPVVEPPAPFAALLARKASPLFIAALDGRSWHDVARFVPERGPLAIAIGPEGGFSPAEQAAATASGAVALRLGPHVLRTETAALAATVLVRAS